MLFAYGTLTFPEVAEALFDRLPEAAPAAVANLAAFAVPGRVFPIAAAVASGTLEGVVLRDLDARECHLVAAYEGPLYRKESYRTLDGDPVDVFVAACGGLASPVRWDAARFESHDLEDYVRRCRRWRVEQAPEAARR